jgi:phenylalanyl-tRNA synthetase alpha chain
MDELAEIFADMGFAVASGPEIEDDWHNFTALNMPETHPARAMHDTFYFPTRMRKAATCCCARIPRPCRSARC